MEFEDVVAHGSRLGPLAHLATVSPSASPHVTPIHVDWVEGWLWAAIGLGSVKAANIASHPDVCLHYQVGPETGWDSLLVWGRGTIHADVETKTRMWTALSYDLSLFSPGGPEGSPDTVFLSVEPRRALLLVRYGLDDRDEWRAAPG